MWSVFVIVCVVLGQSLPIYDSHHRRWLLHWCAGPLGPYHDDFPSVYYNNLYYDKLFSAPVMEGRGWWRAFGSC
jgi:hypothetical protein